MKKSFLSILFLLICPFSLFSQDMWSHDSRRTTFLSEESKVTVESSLNSLQYKNPNIKMNTVKTIDGVAIVYPNIRVHPGIFTQSETPIVSHPTNKNILFGSSNWVNTVTGMSSEGVYVSTNGGNNWYGSDTLTSAPINDHAGDPAPSIDMNGKIYMSYLQRTGDGGVYVTSSTNNGVTWANATLACTGWADKNHLFTINNPQSPYNGNTILSWSNFTVQYPNIVVSVTSDNGTTWSPKITVQNPPAGVFAQGVNGSQGPNGEAYLVWQSPATVSPFTGQYIGFAKSTNGGFNWSANNNIYACNGIRGTLDNKSFIRVNDYPIMSVDLSNGPRRGWIYVVTPEKNLSPAGSDPDIILHRSTDGGFTWSTGIRVNQDPLNNGKDQYMPSVCVGFDGSVNIVYYDSRNTSSDSAEVYVSRSLDGGITFNDILVSDHRFKPRPILGTAPGYQGDYISITEGPENSMIPFWADNSSGIYQAWTTKVSFYTHPLNSFNLTAPDAGTTITTLPGENTVINFNWDTSASTASYKWTFFSPSGNQKLMLETALNKLTFTSSELDALLAGIGVNPGDSLVGNWNVMAFRNNSPINDSLPAANGPRPITLKRAKPILSEFSLNTPVNEATITTSAVHSNPVTFNWSKSGEGVLYKIFWTSASTNFKINTLSNNSGFDTLWTIPEYSFDYMLQNAGLSKGDSVNGQWTVYAFSGSDSLKSVQSWNLTLKRRQKGDWLIAYDSTQTGGRISKDSVTYWMDNLGKTFDLFNKGLQNFNRSISFRDYKGVIWLGENESVMSTVQKDSIKSYLNNGSTSNKSNLLIFSQDIGYQFDNNLSSYYDSSFARQYLGFNWVLDRPQSGGKQGLIGDGINFGLADSTIGEFPDVIYPSWNGGIRLYKFRSLEDNGNAVGVKRETNNVVVFGDDIRSLRAAVDSPPEPTILRFLQGAFTIASPEPVGVTDNLLISPSGYILDQNYPNPFNPSTVIKFSIPYDGLVTLRVYNVLGERVMTLVDGNMKAGKHEVKFDASKLASGIYLYKLDSGNFTSVKKMVLLK